jgi:hypothetical protein
MVFGVEGCCHDHVWIGDLQSRMTGGDWTLLRPLGVICYDTGDLI